MISPAVEIPVDPLMATFPVAVISPPLPMTIPAALEVSVMAAPLTALLRVTVEAEFASKLPPKVMFAFTVTTPAPEVLKIKAPVPVFVISEETMMLPPAAAFMVMLLAEFSALAPVAAPLMVMVPASVPALAVLTVTAVVVKELAIVAQLRFAGVGVAGVVKAGAVAAIPAVSEELLIFKFVGSNRSMPV